MGRVWRVRVMLFYKYLNSRTRLENMARWGERRDGTWEAVGGVHGLRRFYLSGWVLFIFIVEYMNVYVHDTIFLSIDLSSFPNISHDEFFG